MPGGGWDDVLLPGVPALGLPAGALEAVLGLRLPPLAGRCAAGDRLSCLAGGCFARPGWTVLALDAALAGPLPSFPGHEMGVCIMCQASAMLYQQLMSLSEAPDLHWAGF